MSEDRERVKQELVAIDEGKKRAVDNYKYFRDLPSKNNDPAHEFLVEHQVAKAFEQGVLLGKKIADKEV